MESNSAFLGSFMNCRVWLVFTLSASLIALIGCARATRVQPSGSQPDRMEESWIQLLHLEMKEDQAVVCVPRRLPLPALTTMAIGVAFGGEVIELPYADSIAGHRRLQLESRLDSEDRFLIRGVVPIELFVEALEKERMEFIPLRTGASTTSGLYSEVRGWNLLPAKISCQESSKLIYARCRVKRRIWVEGLPPGALLALCEVVIPLSIHSSDIDSFLTLGLAVLEHDMIRLGPDDFNYEVLGAWAKQGNDEGEAIVSTSIRETSGCKESHQLVQLYCFGEETRIPNLPDDFELPYRGWTGVDWEALSPILADRSAMIGRRLRLLR